MKHQTIKNSPEMMDVFMRIADERLRQQKLFIDGAILFTCSSPVADMNRKLRALTFEVGHVADAINNLEILTSMKGKDTSSRNELQRELVQVAAVATAWLEALEVELKPKT